MSAFAMIKYKQFRNLFARVNICEWQVKNRSLVEIVVKYVIIYCNY